MTDVPKIKTAYHLKQWYETLNPGRYFFTPSTLRFFGDTMANFGVRNFHHNGVAYVELRRKRSVHGGLKSSEYFRLHDMTHSSKHPADWNS